MIVENRTGAAGRIGVQAVKAAAPDGNTVLLTPIAPMSVFQSVYKNLGYDPIADFKPITQIATFDLGVAVGPGSDAKSLKDLVAWLKANPAQANYGMPAAGSLPHFFGVLFGRAAGVDLKSITYRGSAAALTDLVGGQVPVVFTTTTDLLPLHRAGRIRILATSGAQRSPFLPEVPTFKESGYDIQGAGWYGMFAPGQDSRRHRRALQQGDRVGDRHAGDQASGCSTLGSSRPAPRRLNSPPSRRRTPRCGRRR